MTVLPTTFSLILLIALPMSVSIAVAQAPQPSENPTINAPKAPAITKPAVTAPTVSMPTALPLKGSPTPAPIGGKARAALATVAYTEAAYQSAVATGAPVALLFSDSTDPNWAKQAPVLQLVLRELEFKAIKSFQVDAVDTAILEKFNVTAPATILIMKDGSERIRSAQMTNAEVIRKMLRLSSAL